MSNVTDELWKRFVSHNADNLAGITANLIKENAPTTFIELSNTLKKEKAELEKENERLRITIELLQKELVVVKKENAQLKGVDPVREFLEFNKRIKNLK